MVRIFELDDRGDQRGSSYSLQNRQFAFLGSVEDVHFSTTLPGRIRGNHFHRLRNEVLVVRYEDSWTLAWDQGEGTSTESRKFDGSGTVVVEIEPLASHAVRNDGQRPLLIFAMTNGLAALVGLLQWLGGWSRNRRQALWVDLA
jgi:dTDP-4-dehydrorhamnose 3,5-epimerase-like enzyme